MNSGWNYEGDWVVDHLLDGDKDGWLYALDDVFWGNAATLDNVER